MNSKKWTTLLIMSLSSLMATINSSSLNAVLPYISKILHLNINESQMILVVYLIVLTAILTICGKIADILGHKKIFLTGIAIFGLSSLMVLLGENVTTIIIMRVIQAIGASLMVASGPTILLNTFEPQRRGFAIGIQTTGISLGLIIGPPIGGIIIKYLSWQWLFLINIPFALVSFITITFIIKGRENSGYSKEPYDFYGMIIWAISIPLILISFILFSHKNQNALIPSILLTAGVGLMFYLIRYELRINSPFFPISLIKIPAYYGGLFSLLSGYTALFISNFLIPFYLTIVLHLEPQQTGFIMSTTSIAMFVTTGVSGYLSDRIGFYKPCIIGMSFLTIGMLILSFTNTDSALIQIIIAQIIIGSGLGIFNSPNTTALLNIGGTHSTGITTGLLATMRNLGMSFGTVTAGVLISVFNIILYNSPTEKINDIPSENFNYLFRYSMLFAFLISSISIYLSTIRKGTPLISSEQKL